MLSTKMRNKLHWLWQNKKWEIIALLTILAIGIFLRSFHFASWLHFELDQTYDVQTVSPALEHGPSYLSLFGPNVGGGALRLGPAFYYMEYLGALVFGNNPPGHAMAVLLLNIAAIPLFYFFCRRFFSVVISLGLDAIFAVSLFGVMYSRFSWSPNVLPFLTLLSFYSLLRSVSPKEKNASSWFLLAVAAVTITSQIHLNSFFAIPAIAVLFVVYKRPSFSWKTWVSAIFIVLFIYSPMIASDIRNHGENTNLLREKFTKTAGRQTSLLRSASQAIIYQAYGSWFIFSSDDQIGNMQLKGAGFACTDCQKNLPLKILAIVLFLTSGAIMLWQIKKQKTGIGKDFLVINFLWLIVSLALFYTIAKSYRMYPRFFLIVSPLAILLPGFILQYLKPELNKKRLLLFSAIIAFFVTANIAKIAPIFDSLSKVATSEVPSIQEADIFPYTNRLTYAAEQNVVKYIYSHAQNGFPVYLDCDSNFAYTYWYLLGKDGVTFYDGFAENGKIYANGNYFVIQFADQKPFDDPRFSIIEKKDLGSVVVYNVKPEQQYVTAQTQLAWQKKISKEDYTLSQLLTWHKLFKY